MNRHHRHRTRYTLLAISLAFLSPIAIGQGTAPQESDSEHVHVYLTQASPSTPKLPALDFGAPEIQSETIAPANTNILDREPPDPRDEQPQTWCNNNPLTGKIPVECVRWSQMASQRSLPRLRSDT